MKEKELNKALKDTGLSKDSFEWLYKWSWKKAIPLTDGIKQELKKYRPTSSETLYRGTQNTLEKESKHKLISYSHQKGYGDSIAETGDFNEGTESGYLIERVIDPKDILVDISLIPNYDKYFTNEVIVIKNERMKQGGIVEKLNTKVSFKDLFTK